MLMETWPALPDDKMPLTAPLLNLIAFQANLKILQILSTPVRQLWLEYWVYLVSMKTFHSMKSFHSFHTQDQVFIVCQQH